MTFQLARMLRRAERTVTRTCSLVPFPLDPSLARAEGTLRGAPVVLETQAWTGGPSSPVAWARFATMQGAGVEVGNVVILSRARFPLPVLGADLVALTPRSAMLAADLSPSLPPGPRRDAQLDEVARVRASHPPLPSAGALPAFCARFFSPHHVFARFAPEEHDAAERVFFDLVRSFVSLVEHAAPDDSTSEAVAAMHADYAEAHVSEDKGLEVLARAFGRPWAVRYVDEVMFPRSPETAGATPPSRSGAAHLAVPKDISAR